MNHFNIKPCKEIGLIKEKIKNAILDGDIRNDYKEAFNLNAQNRKIFGIEG